MTLITNEDPLGSLTPLVREIYDLSEGEDMDAIRYVCLRLYVEIARARKRCGLAPLPSEVLHTDGNA